MKNLANLEPLEYCKILWRRRWYALAAFLLVGIAIAVYSWFTPDVYRSESMIMVEAAIVPQDYARPSDRSSPEEQIASIRQQVLSRSFAERMIQEFQLFGYGSGEFSLSAAIRGFSSSLQVVSNSRNTLTISYDSTDAQVAQTVLKRVVNTLKQSSESSRKTKAEEADQFVDEQLRQTQQKLVEQENKIKQFKMVHFGELPQQSVANLNALSGLNSQLAEVNNSLQQIRVQQKQQDISAQQQKQLAMLLDQSSPSGSAENAAQSPISSNPLLETKQAQLRALLWKYTPSHPDVIRVTREIEEMKRQEQASLSQKLSADAAGKEPANAGKKEDVADIGGSSLLGADSMMELEAAGIKLQAETYKTEIAKREKERDDIVSQIKTYQKRLNLGPELEQEYDGLTREYETLRQQHGNLQNQKFQARITTDLETNKNSNAFRVVDEANLPERPSFPNRKQIILLGLGAAMLTGIGAAFGREFLDSTLASEDEVMALLKLPVLGVISEIPPKKPKRLLQIAGMSKGA